MHTSILVHLRAILNQCSASFSTTEAAASFKAVISGARELLGDAERIAGKWTKDDKVGYRMYLNVLIQVMEPVRTSHR